MKEMKSKSGFSVAELMVVVVIISLLAGGIALNATRFKNPEDSPIKKSMMEKDKLIISEGIFLYKELHGKYPATFHELLYSGVIGGDGKSPYETLYELDSDLVPYVPGKTTENKN